MYEKKRYCNNFFSPQDHKTAKKPESSPAKVFFADPIPAQLRKKIHKTATLKFFNCFI